MQIDLTNSAYAVNRYYPPKGVYESMDRLADGKKTQVRMMRVELWCWQADA